MEENNRDGKGEKLFVKKFLERVGLAKFVRGFLSEGLREREELLNLKREELEEFGMEEKEIKQFEKEILVCFFFTKEIPSPKPKKKRYQIFHPN